MSDLHRIRTVDVARLEFGEPHADAIVLELGVDNFDEPILFWVLDAQAYTIIRRMNEVLFDIDPPRSGVGSPGASLHE